MNEELPAFYSEDFDRVLSPGEIMTGYGKVKKGYEYPAVKFVVISESDIFGFLASAPAYFWISSSCVARI